MAVKLKSAALKKKKTKRKRRRRRKRKKKKKKKKRMKKKKKKKFKYVGRKEGRKKERERERERERGKRERGGLCSTVLYVLLKKCLANNSVTFTTMSNLTFFGTLLLCLLAQRTLLRTLYNWILTPPWSQ